MSGHSKWANIQHKKGIEDRKRSTVFTKLARLILIAIRQGGGNTNPDMNLSLKTAIERAKEANMPRENIERLLTAFESRKNNLQNFVFEGFGPFGVPIVIECESDNKNRIVAEIKFILKDFGGNLGESGSVSYLFERGVGMEIEGILDDEKQLQLIDAGVENFEGNRKIFCRSEDLSNVEKKIGELGMKIISKDIVMRAKTNIDLKDEEKEEIKELIDSLELNDDVVKIFVGTNL
jgi:YebC/PmpR family DNA-binding regulatory protein